MNKEAKKNLISYIAIKLAWLLILFLGKTGISTIHNRKYVRYAQRCGKPIMYVVWHGHMLLPIFAHRNQNIYAMVSEHGDGEIIAKTIERLGYKTIRGSSTRGGSKAFREMLRVLKKGNNCTILPDGPTGPRHEFKMGAALLAQRTGAVILPTTFSAKKPIEFKSWDKFIIWWPFTRITIAYGRPTTLPRKASPEEMEIWRQKLENNMNQLQAEADGLFSA